MQQGDAGSAVPVGMMRVGDSDRDRTVDLLRAAFAEGRLDLDEFTERMEAAYASKTYAQLAALTADLPTGQTAIIQPAAAPAELASAGESAPAVAEARPPVSRLAILSVILAVIGIASDGVASILAVVLAFLAAASIEKTGYRGMRLATAGLVFGVIGGVIGLMRAFGHLP
jgi:hypothetical protein